MMTSEISGSGISDKKINIGLGEHLRYGWEKPHYHTISTEYQYVIRGSAKYVDLELNKEYLVSKGDFFVIYPNTRYILKAQKGCTIIFVKCPAVNDKIKIDISEKMRLWVSCWKNQWEDGLKREDSLIKT